MQQILADIAEQQDIEQHKLKYFKTCIVITMMDIMRLAAHIKMLDNTHLIQWVGHYLKHGRNLFMLY